ncbi:S41 family peptidase [Pedobacter nototheniae]|uniref:S41 family peptidase n=1 Tax=Pedobacter nototheniae TaxID=2488994 RepID=UPI00103C6B82|nr:S41 family peptidase [Pedobacter nototheniae]
MYRLIIILSILTSNICIAQNITKIKVNSKSERHSIERKQQAEFEVRLTKDVYYNISVEQLGIDVVVYLKDEKNKILEQKDSPTGQKGIEKIVFSPNVSGKYIIAVKPLEEAENSDKGDYTICTSTLSENLKKYSIKELQQDFDFLKNAYLETHVGLWYNSYTQFDSLCNVQNAKLRDQMTALDFYKIVAPITAFTKEGHCYISTSDGINDYFKQSGGYFPFLVKIINRKIYVLNDHEDLKTKGLMISKINGLDAGTILSKFESIEPADGYNITSKEHWIENSFAKYYRRFFEKTKSFKIEFVSATADNITYNIPALTSKEYAIFYQKFIKENTDYKFSKPSEFSLDTLKNLAKLTVNDLGSRNYKGGKKGFQKYLDEIFTTINSKHIKNLIIDIRKNEGGSQGMEDILLSYFSTKSYQKYKYVEIPSFSYSFLKYTDYKDEADILKKELSEEFYKAVDGRYLNKKGYYDGLPPSSIHFYGNVYILISGLTFSGGSEFASLAKNHSNAVFIGEETGGGYYGNTSGSFLKFTLPNTALPGRIPLCKFVLETQNNSIPFGHGLSPDYEIRPTIQEYLNKQDVEMELAKAMIREK